ncbi:MAG: hypothetical protein AB7S93_00975 [Xanthobacteraceae bacterium]
MRAFLLATVVAAGLGLAGTTATLAAPVNGAAIAQAADAGKAVEQVRWWRYRYHWRWHRPGYYHRYYWRRW